MPLLNRNELAAHPYAPWVALGTVAIKTFSFFYVRRLGQETHNPIVDALDYDHLTDIWSASAAEFQIFIHYAQPVGIPILFCIGSFLILRIADLGYTRLFSVMNRGKIVK